VTPGWPALLLRRNARIPAGFGFLRHFGLAQRAGGNRGRSRCSGLGLASMRPALLLRGNDRIPAALGFLRHCGVAQCAGGSRFMSRGAGPELASARQRSFNHDPLTSRLDGPWDRGNPCRRRPAGAGGAAGGRRWADGHSEGVAAGINARSSRGVEARRRCGRRRICDTPTHFCDTRPILAPPALPWPAGSRRACHNAGGGTDLGPASAGRRARTW
jgi:hypothetical protein